MQSLCSKLGKAWIPINLGNYYTHKVVLGYVSKCRNYKIKKKEVWGWETNVGLEPSFQAFIIFRCIRCTWRLVGAGTQGPQITPYMNPSPSAIFTVWRGTSSNAELLDSVVGLGKISQAADRMQDSTHLASPIPEKEKTKWQVAPTVTWVVVPRGVMGSSSSITADKASVKPPILHGLRT
jgi:hypothetical protein